MTGLAAKLHLDPSTLRITALTGGVSSDIYLLEDHRQRLVAKQSIPKLRVKEDWPCDPARIHREIAALEALEHTGAVPRVVYKELENNLYVMTAAPAGAEPWKALLLRGEADPGVAARIAGIQRQLIETNPTGFEDQGFFDDLRLDPYYRFTARRHPDLSSHFNTAIEACRRPLALTHGDWSPKNIMVAGRDVLALDFECIHLGDPAFDTAFMLNHLLLKSIHLGTPGAFLPCAKAFEGIVPWPDVMTHLPCLMLARMDGKSPVEYIQSDAVKEHVRALARAFLRQPPGSVEETWDSLKRQA